MSIDHITDEELIFIDNTLEKYDNDLSISGASELDGFLAAIASTPETIPQEEWLAAIWGGEEKTPQWQNEKEAQRFTQITLKLLNYSTTTLKEDADTFEALFIFDEDGNEDSKIVFYWCAGYMRAVEMREHIWANLPDPEAQYLAQIAMFCDPDYLTALEKMSADRLADFQDAIEPAVCDLYAFWQQQPTKKSADILPFSRQTPKAE